MKLTCNPTCLGMDNIWCSPRVSSIRMLGGGMMNLGVWLGGSGLGKGGSGMMGMDR